MRPSSTDVLRPFADLSWIADRLLYLYVSGSHAYGTATATSDRDYRGCIVGLTRHYLGCMEGFEQAERGRADGGFDAVIYDVRKFFRLLAQANPMSLESLWVEDEDRLYVHPIMWAVLQSRDLFLTKRIVHTFGGGYAFSQIKRMETHRRWLLKPVDTKPTRADFGLPEQKPMPQDHLDAAEAAIQKRIDLWDFDWERAGGRDVRMELQGHVAALWAELDVSAEDLRDAAARGLGMGADLIEHLKRERRHRTALHDWHQYEKWKRERNPERAALEAKSGFDAKHASHVVRLYRMAIEALATGVVRVRRPDAAELLAIRRGEWTYEQVMAEATRLQAEMETAAADSRLPRAPDHVAVQALCVSVVSEGLRLWG